jgi:hypothetical protein
MTQVADYKTQLLAALDERASHEVAKNVENDSIQSCIKKMRATVERSDVLCEIMLLSNVSAQFINRAERVSARFNVYSAEKVLNIANTATNHYTLAIFKTALALEAKSLTLNHKDAVSACSASVKHSDSKREAIIKATRYAKHVAANTASTQSSSSINALQVANVLTETRDDANVISYRVNRESYAAQLLAKRHDLTL